MSVILKALAMIRPSADFVQAPSDLRASAEISDETFASIADTGKASLVSLEEDGVSNPQRITSYTLGGKIQTDGGDTTVWPGRYIVSDVK